MDRNVGGIIGESESARAGNCSAMGQKGKQQWWCKDCKRKFAENTALPKMRSPVAHVGSAVQQYYNGMSLNAICRNIEQLQEVIVDFCKPYEYEYIVNLSDYELAQELLKLLSSSATK